MHWLLRDLSGIGAIRIRSESYNVGVKTESDTETLPAPPPSKRIQTRSPGPVPGGRLLSYYDRMRGQLLEAADRRSHKLGKPAVEALLLVPDVFVLLVRLALDRQVPGEARALIGGALAYFVLPFDLFPEAVVGGAGYLDDLVLAAAVLSQALGGELEPYARKYWNGDQELRELLHEVSASAGAILGRNLHGRLRQALLHRGVELPPEEKPAKE
jgi:uncharacterized membrane protein YkvA (DUF1232 family)